MALPDAEDRADTHAVLSNLTEPKEHGRRLSLTSEEWHRVGELLTALRTAWEQADERGVRRALGRLEAISNREVTQVPGPWELPAPPEIIEERNALVTSLDLVLGTGQGAGTGDASSAQDD